MPARSSPLRYTLASGSSLRDCAPAPRAHGPSGKAPPDLTAGDRETGPTPCAHLQTDPPRCKSPPLRATLRTANAPGSASPHVRTAESHRRIASAVARCVRADTRHLSLPDRSRAPVQSAPSLRRARRGSELIRGIYLFRIDLERPFKARLRFVELDPEEIDAAY